jgi:B12 binding domain
VLACPPGEHHDLALMVFGIVLHRSGWRIDYLGINTPVEELAGTVGARQPDLVVLAATLPETLELLIAQLTTLARRAPLALAGPGATPRLAAVVQARLLGGDPVTAAENIWWPPGIRHMGRLRRGRAPGHAPPAAERVSGQGPHRSFARHTAARPGRRPPPSSFPIVTVGTELAFDTLCRMSARKSTCSSVTPSGTLCTLVSANGTLAYSA